MLKEDYLMRQIEEFRDKAKQLQLLLNAKEQQVSELEKIVNDREHQANELDVVLQAKRDEADQLVVAVTIQVQEMIQALDRQMEQFGVQMDREVKNVSEPIQKLEEKLDAIKIDICEKVHTEDVKCYRNMKSLIEEQTEKFDDVTLSEKSLKSIRKSFKGLKFLAFFALLDFILIIGILLMQMGIFTLPF